MPTIAANGLLLGIEAASAGTHAIVVRDGEIVERMTGAGMDVLLDPDALDRLAQLITESGATTAGLGVAGLNTEREARLLEMQLRVKTGATVTVGDDTEIALLGAFSGGPGIIVIAHAGSNSMGRAENGQTARSGGHGKVVGDEGSEYWIAAQAIRTALQSADGRIEPARALETAVTEAYGMPLDAVVRNITENRLDYALTLRFAKTAMAVNHPATDAILDEAADDLIAHVNALRKTLGHLPVAMYGSVFDHPRIRARFTAATGAVDVQQSPVHGAVLLGIRKGAGRNMGWRAG